MGSHYTFLTFTDPALGETNTKLMRAHVTRKNFERRRKRLLSTTSRSKLESSTKSRSGKHESPVSADSRYECTTSPASLILTESSHAAIHQLYRTLRPLLLTLAADKATLIRERSWIQLNYSEPALLEASLALTILYHGLTGIGPVTDAYAHQAKAISIVNSRLNDPKKALDDGVLGAVFTLAFCERLAKRETGYEIHMAGFRHMIQLRKKQNNIYDELSWFSDLLMLDMSEDSKPPFQSQGVAPLSFLPHPTSGIIGSILEDLSDLRIAIEYSNSYEVGYQFLSQEIDERILMIQNKADTLRGKMRYTDALGLSIRIFLLLSNDRAHISVVELSNLASDLRIALGEPEIRLCTSFEFTAWQLFVGSIAAAAGSATDTWFKTTIWRISRALVLSEWREILAILSKTFMPHSQLLQRFESMWTEVMDDKTFHV